MAPRRAQSTNTLSPQRGPSSPITQGFPRSNSPSSGITQFLSRPSKWFGRSASASKLPQSSGVEPRASTSSSTRKHNISRPTDPRPILDSYAGGASRSVLDLSARPQGSLDISQFPPTSTPSSPSAPNPGGMGDLRSISRRGWSKSVDDLGKSSPGNFSPIDTSFQDKVAEYRNRRDSNTSAMSPSSLSSASMISGQHPFPTVTTASPSSSPPKGVPLPSVSISISAPALDDNPTGKDSNVPHVHTRSHSFTPKLSSKLATPRFVPPSPKRKGSGSSGGDVDAKDWEKSSAQGQPRGAFNFGFGGNKAVPQDFNANLAVQPQAANRSTTLLAPPTIIGPEDGDDNATKRTSQIVYQTGFINRLADVPNHFHHTNLALSKGWKPFKLELKGSKIYFYKPPGDKTNGIKDLFPTGFVPPSPDDEEADRISNSALTDDAESTRKGKAKEDPPTIGRKRRAFWGRRTHPDLSLVDGKIEKGTLEALVHETVFATTFRQTSDSSEQESEGSVNVLREEWRNFASSVLLSVPSFVSQAKFEIEFLRCCAYLVSGADDSTKEDERARVGWLAGEYLRYQGLPADRSAWEEWRSDTIPNIASAIVQPTMPSAMPTTTSMQALYNPSPLLNTGSPNITTFSPRPEDGTKLVSLLEALDDHSPAPSSPSETGNADTQSMERQQSLHPPSTQTQTQNRMPWAALEQEGLSREVFLSLDPNLIARSLILFHRSVLDQAPENVTADFVIISESQSSSHAHNAHDPSFVSFSPLFGSNDQPHWLTKLLLMQILGADTSGGNAAASQLSSPSQKSDERNTQTSKTHSRSEVISVWARVGELCRLAGDECSWKAIVAALCSRPVARLDKAWKRVDPLALAAIEAWVYPGSDGESTTVEEPRVTPWGGDIKNVIKDELAKTRGDNGDEFLLVEPLEKTRSLFEGFRTSFSLCPRRLSIIEGEVNEDVRRMVAYWRDMSADGGGTGALAQKFQRVDQFMSLSLAAEPRRKGLFEPYHWTRSLPAQANALTQPSSLLPLLFPEPLPGVCLIDRAHLSRGRVDSDASDAQFLRGIDAHERRNIEPTNIGKSMAGGLAVLGHSGTVIPVYNGDLLLVVQTGVSESTASSRPPSTRPPSSVVDAGMGTERTFTRSPSIRVKPGSSQGLDRKTSIARRSSLPSVSHRQNFVTSEPSSEPPLRVLVQAGTLNTLVDILVHGLRNVSVSVADDNGEMSLREGMTRDLVVDQAEFAKVWWNVYRSFVTSMVFFELLRKLYITAQPMGSSPSAGQYLQAASNRTEVLNTLKEWLTTGGGAQDMLDDSMLFDALLSFFDTRSDHQVFESNSFEDARVRQAWVHLAQTKDSLRALFISQTMRPAISRSVPRATARSDGVRTRNLSTREPPDIDRILAEEFVDNLDGMACAAFSNVTEEDLYITADLLEVQTSDRTSWFSPRESGSTEESIEIQTMYTHIQEVEPSSLIGDLNQDVIYRLLPPGIRSCVRAYGILRKWLISKIVAPKLGLRTRQARMDLLLQVIEISRQRNSVTESAMRIVDHPCVRSFVEAVTTSAVLSIESRMHQRAWQNVAASRGAQCDTLVSLLSHQYTPTSPSGDALTVDMGWLIERMLEVISTPDIVQSTAQDGLTLINFDKRRHLCNLISKAPSLPSARRKIQPDEINRRGFERLNNVEKEVFLLQFDHRGIKEEAVREASQAPMNGTSSARKVARPFNRLVVYQMEKYRRDKNLRLRLQKEKIQEQTRNEKRDDILNRAMRPRKPGTVMPKQHRNKKSMSAFLHFMRPISTAFGAEVPQSPGIKKTAAELDFVPSGKPSLVLSLVDAQVAQFINNERSFTFQLDTEDGGHYLLQALNKREMMKWLETINRVTKMAAKRRLTYLGPKPQLSDHIHNHPTTASRDPKAVFGVELEFLLQREAGGQVVQPGTIPTVIEQCLSEIEARGLSEVGIYRIAGATSEINNLKDAYNRGESPIERSTDIHAVCDLVKSWFRILPEPVFPSLLYHDVIRAMQLENLNERLSGVRSVVRRLPQANFDLLRRVSEHLDKVTDFEEHNQMTAEALAIVFSPNLLRAPQNDFVMILANMGHTHKLVKALITHFHVIFDDTDPEAEEIHSEDEFDSPILEEDEEEDEESMHHEQEHSDNGQDYTPS